MSRAAFDHLCSDCDTHFNHLKTHLDMLEITFTVNHRLVRGLDYYTRTVFEIQPKGGSAQSTLGGGGRYDDLIEELGGKSTPAIGFATGMERIILNLKKQNIAIPTPPGLQALIAYMGDEAWNEAIKLASRLRQAGISAVADNQAVAWREFYNVIHRYHPRFRIIRVPKGLAWVGTRFLSAMARLRTSPFLFTPGGVAGWTLALPVRPGLLWEELGIKPEYPTIREGIPAVLDESVVYRWLHPLADGK